MRGAPLRLPRLDSGITTGWEDGAQHHCSCSLLDACHPLFPHYSPNIQEQTVRAVVMASCPPRANRTTVNTLRPAPRPPPPPPRPLRPHRPSITLSPTLLIPPSLSLTAARVTRRPGAHPALLPASAPAPTLISVRTVAAADLQAQPLDMSVSSATALALSSGTETSR